MRFWLDPRPQSSRPCYASTFQAALEPGAQVGKAARVFLTIIHWIKNEITKTWKMQQPRQHFWTPLLLAMKNTFQVRIDDQIFYLNKMDITDGMTVTGWGNAWVCPRSRWLPG